MKDNMKKVIGSILLAGVLTALAAMPAYAGTGFCDPGRASSHINVTTYSEAKEFTSDWIDEVRSDIDDHDPFVEAGSTSFAFVSLRISGSNYIRGSYRKSANGNISLWVTFVQSGDVVFDGVPAGSNPFNGQGTDSHKLALNWHDNFIGGDTFQFLVNGTPYQTFGVGEEDVFHPDAARIGVDINDGGSQWWGRNTERLVMKDGEAVMKNGGHLLNWDTVNNTNKAGTNATLTNDNQLRFLVWDKDCA